MNLKDYVQENLNSGSFNEEELNEGFKDIIKDIKSKFAKVVNWMKGVIVKAQGYWLSLFEKDGSILPAITQATTGEAYMDGRINKAKTTVVVPPALQGHTKNKTKWKDAVSMYGSGNSLNYYIRAIKEAEENGTLKPINEVRLQTQDPSAKYNVVDNDELMEEIMLTLKNPKLARLLIYGAPGIGKTAILQQVGKAYEGVIGKQFSLIVKTLSNETPENFFLPKYVDNERGEQRAEDVPKTWLPVYKPTGDPEKDAASSLACGNGLLFIDELSRATPQVLNVILPLINEGELNGWKLGEGWRIICASNRMEDEAYGQTELGNALKTRFRIVYYEPTVKTWAQWAKKQNYMSPLLLDWLQLPEKETHSGGKYFYWDPNEENPDSPASMMCTPRTWDNAMKNLAVYAQTGDKEGWDILDIPTRVLQRALSSSIPPQAIDAFVAFLNVIREVGDLGEFANSVWSKGTGKIKPDTLNKIPFQICQLLITSKIETLPDKKEMENLFKWLVKTGNAALASYVIDTIKNVYAPNTPNTHKENIFWLRDELDRLKGSSDPKDKTSYNNLINIHSKDAKAFGMKDATEWPDWSTAVDIFASDPKFQEIFSMRDSNGKLMFDKE